MTSFTPLSPPVLSRALQKLSLDGVLLHDPFSLVSIRVDTQFKITNMHVCELSIGQELYPISHQAPNYSKVNPSFKNKNLSNQYF